MSKEDTHRPYQSDAEIFGLTEKEQLWDRLSNERFQKIVADPDTKIHEAHVSTNTYGEFLFILLSRMGDMRQAVLTFFSLGFHELREEWVTDHWRWYSSHSSFVEDKSLSLAETQEVIQARQTEIESYTDDDEPSDSAMLFSILAEITDEDGAWAALDDMGWPTDIFKSDDEDQSSSEAV